MKGKVIVAGVLAVSAGIGINATTHAAENPPAPVVAPVQQHLPPVHMVQPKPVCTTKTSTSTKTTTTTKGGKSSTSTSTSTGSTTTCQPAQGSKSHVRPLTVIRTAHMLRHP